MPNFSQVSTNSLKISPIIDIVSD